MTDSTLIALRRCATCEKTKPASEFYKNRAQSCGTDRECKECKKIRNTKHSRKPETRNKTSHKYAESMVRYLDLKPSDY
jgi:hypothetical protein